MANFLEADLRPVPCREEQASGASAGRAERPHRRQVDTLILGGQGFGDAVLAGASGAGRRLVFHERGTTPMPDPPNGIWDELVVEASIGEPMPAELLDRARSVIVVDPDEASRAFGPVLPVFGRAVKRAIDIVAAAVLLVLVLPAVLIAVPVIRLDSPGPALFRQERIGRNGRRFKMWKLRTMRTDADATLHAEYVRAMIEGRSEASDGLFKLSNDPRVTSVGRFLRRTSFDEVPQLVNVLLGQMSLVGPRPPLEYETRLYDSATWRRLRVVPGLTGAWQVSGRSMLPFCEMVDLDVDYWRCWSIRQDIRILIRTPKAVLSARGAA